MLYTIVAVLVLVLDQAVKYWTVSSIAPMAAGGDTVALIPGVIHMTNVQNTGAAFAILADQRWLLVGVSALFIICIIVLISMDIIHTKFGRWTSVLVMAGALGNCIDRVMYGYVVDMFEFELFSFAVFNVADIFITVCGILFCIHVIIYREPAEVRDAVPMEDRGRLSRLVDRNKDDEPSRRTGRRAARDDRQDRPDPYANVPHRGAHTPLADEIRPQDPSDPFAEWSFGGDGGSPAPKAGRTPPAAPVQPSAPAHKAAPKTGGWDDYEPSVDDLPVRPGAVQKTAGPKAQSAPKTASAPDAGLGDYSLEDILSEFRDY